MFPNTSNHNLQILRPAVSGRAFFCLKNIRHDNDKKRCKIPTISVFLYVHIQIILIDSTYECSRHDRRQPDKAFIDFCTATFVRQPFPAVLQHGGYFNCGQICKPRSFGCGGFHRNHYVHGHGTCKRHDYRI